jgi:hypothetical protein
MINIFSSIITPFVRMLEKELLMYYKPRKFDGSTAFLSGNKISTHHSNNAALVDAPQPFGRLRRLKAADWPQAYAYPTFLSRFCINSERDTWTGAVNLFLKQTIGRPLFQLIPTTCIDSPISIAIQEMSGGLGERNTQGN